MADKSELSDIERLPPLTAELWFPRGPSLNVRVRGVTGHEQLSGTYQFEVDFSIEAGTIDIEQLLGVHCELTFDRGGVGRHVYGIVARVEFALDAEAQASAADEGARVVITPAFALLDQEIDTRFFSGRSVIDILAEVLGAGLGDYGREADVESHIVHVYPRRDYCVQFRESTLAFCERIMQEEGIGYLFEPDHEGERERMVLFDNNEDCAHVEFLVPEPIRIVRDRADELDRESLQQLDWFARRVPNRVIARAYNLKDPATLEQAAAQREAKVTRQVVLQGEHRHIIDDPVDDPLAQSFDGTSLEQCQRTASLAFERFGVEAGTGRGRGNAIGFAAGTVFEIGEGSQDPRRGDAMLLTSVHHRATSEEAPGINSFQYENHFECTSSTTPFRPARSRLRPSVQGVLTGVVVGPQGEEIHSDALGRVQVRFHADRHATDDEPSSCWVRVAQMWAGRGYGAMVIPRVGMEVVVSFVDGNPDCPIVTGCVYNGANEPPYSLPGELTKTTFKSGSLPGGDGFNEIRLEDAKGAEQIFVHGQRRMDLRVRGPLFETAGGGRDDVVGGDHSTWVHGDVHHRVMGTSYVKTEGPRYTCAADDVIEDFQTQHIVVAGKSSQLSAPKIVLEASELIGLQTNEMELAATASVSVLGCGKVVLESYKTLELKVGSSFISLAQGAVSIGGDLVRINSGGAAGNAETGPRVDLSMVFEPWDALSADDGKPGRKHGQGGGGGGRSRPEGRRLEPHHPPDKPKRDPVHPGDEDSSYSKKDGKGLLESLEWRDAEAWCGETADLAVEVEHATLTARGGLWLLDAIDGATLVSNIGFDLRDHTHKTQLAGILPREFGGQREKERLLHASAYSKRTPAPLRLRFLSDLPASTQTFESGSFQISVSNYEIKVRGTIRYLRAWMYNIIDVSDVVPWGTPGRIEFNGYGTDNWWFCKKVGKNEYKFWDGTTWLRVPDKWVNPDGLNLKGMAVWREPYGAVSTQFGREKWPDSLPSQLRPAEDVRVVLEKWASDIHGIWSDKYDIKCVECGNPFAPECCRLSVSVYVKFVETQIRSDDTVILADNSARANAHAWPLDEASRTAAHEFGHLMGLPDEYEGGVRIDTTVNDDSAKNGIDFKGIMGAGAEVRLRHYNPVAYTLSKAVAQLLGKQWTFKPVAKL